MPVVILRAIISPMTSKALLIEQKTYIDKYPAPIVKEKNSNPSLDKVSIHSPQYVEAGERNKD